jgi:hypothetical protein
MLGRPLAMKEGLTTTLPFQPQGNITGEDFDPTDHARTLRRTTQESRFEMPVLKAL